MAGYRSFKNCCALGIVSGFFSWCGRGSVGHLGLFWFKGGIEPVVITFLDCVWRTQIS